MNKMMRFSKRMLFVLILACLLLSSCSTPAAVKVVEVTQTPVDTATAAPTGTPVPTNTPLPTATATHWPTNTPGPDFEATIGAVATAEMEEQLKKLESDLAPYGYTPADGHLIWSYEDAIDITVEDYNTSLYQNLDAPNAGNFILQTKLTWNTTGGLAGCGIYFRQEEGQDNGSANEFVLYRLQNAPAWVIAFYDFGQWQRNLSEWVYTNSIDDKNDATNVVALVVNGRNIYPYINGKKQRLVEDITLTEGLFALSATQDSGVSTCSFKDTWIWAIDRQQ